MKCELCHKAEAVTAIVREEGEEELYVCNACAKAERLRRQKKSQRTRKISGLPPGMSLSITEISGDQLEQGEPPQILGAIVDAFQGMVSNLERAVSEPKKNLNLNYRDFPLERIESGFKVRDMIHLEALHLIGELDAVKRAIHALDMDLVGVESDGVKEVGHAYKLKYACSIGKARKAVEDLLREERNARVRLFEELPRVFGDSLCRALAITKNCRLLSPGEFFDLLSPLRLAAMEGLLDGISLKEIEHLISDIRLDGYEDALTPNERDREDAERADEINHRFIEVMLNERAEERFL